MKVGVLGGTGTAGMRAVAALERRGHEVRVLARSTGLDVTTGAGMDAGLAGLDTLVDCLGVTKATERAARPVLVDGLRTTLERAAHLGVAHVVSLSILNCDRIPVGYYRTKLAQEEVVRSAPVPGTVLRATQFPQLLDHTWRATRGSGVIAAPSGLLSPIDPRDVGERLADAVEAGPDGGRPGCNSAVRRTCRCATSPRLGVRRTGPTGQSSRSRPSASRRHDTLPGRRRPDGATSPGPWLRQHPRRRGPRRRAHPRVVSRRSPFLTGRRHAKPPPRSCRSANGPFFGSRQEW